MGEAINLLLYWVPIAAIWIVSAWSIRRSLKSHHKFRVSSEFQIASIGFDPCVRLIYPKKHKIRRWKNTGWVAVEQDLDAPFDLPKHLFGATQP